MLARELRQLYIDFFKEKGHLPLHGAPLIPIDVLGREDTSTLFTSAGMQQFKPYFTGEADPPSGRVVTIQKCMRTGDIDSVGDFSHCTFFEMLGNFSFGDYFKAEVIPWTWEFLIDRLGIDPDRICVTVYQDDDEAFDVWHTIIGLPVDRIHRMGEDKNYWPANAITEGPDGPCGPCSEIFYRVAPLEEMASDPSLSPTERYKIDDAAGRWLEIWNNVFTQFNRSTDERGNAVLTPLPKKNNDTGAGFDRIAYVIQGKNSVFETDLFAPILQQIEKLSGKPYKGTAGPLDFAFRVVAEHTRSMVFCIGDTILPSNEGRGYVLRRIMRRAIRFGKTVLGFDEPFLHEIAPRVIEQMGDFYPEITERREHILKTIYAEEEKFRRTLDNGSQRLGEMLESIEKSGSKVLPGSDVFLLYDTFGFPLELTQEIAAEYGLTVDLESFKASLDNQRRQSQAAAGSKDLFKKDSGVLSDLQRVLPPSRFVGYSDSASEGKLVAIIKEGASIDSARAGDEVEIILDSTPFYAESGGQVGDEGILCGQSNGTTCSARIKIQATHKSGGIFVHAGKVLEGEATVGDTLSAAVDLGRRLHIMRNHTATHLLHAALRSILGSHVHQRGSLVAPDRLRFDFTHNQPVTPEELRHIEDMVNEHILQDHVVKIQQDIPISEAKSRGAMALFGEKYGDKVRMVEIPGFSLELCGGTHLAHTSQIGLFKIISETGVSSGVRRIEAVTGAGAYQYVNEQEERLARVASALKSNARDVLTAAERLVAQRSQLEKQVQQLKTGAAADTGALKVSEVAGVPVITGVIKDADAETLASLADRTATEKRSAIVVLAGSQNGKVNLAAKVTQDLVKRGFHAGNLIREVARITGGGGGGRSDFAQAGGRQPDKVDEALAAVLKLVEQQSASS